MRDQINNHVLYLNRISLPFMYMINLPCWHFFPTPILAMLDTCCLCLRTSSCAKVQSIKILSQEFRIPSIVTDRTEWFGEEITGEVPPMPAAVLRASQLPIVPELLLLNSVLDSMGVIW